MHKLPFAIILALCGVPLPAADEPETSGAAERLARAKAHVQRFELRSAEGAAIDRIERPLLSYGDPARANDNGTLWAWGRAGRPVAFLELYQSQNDQTQWINVLTLAALQLPTAEVRPQWRWTPKQTALQLQPIPQAEPPAERASARLSQMKRWAGRFTAHEFWDPNNSRFELRQLVQPVQRYADPAGGIHDGAVFVFAHGTNPEILLLIEAGGDSLEAAKWRFGAVRVGSAELHLLLDGEDVWHLPRTPGVAGRPIDPYWLFVTPSAP
jgi:hypothetical protein